MTPYEDIYTAFLTRILEDEWVDWQIEEAKQDWRQIMEAALVWFRFPKHSLARDEDGFIETLSPKEIQIIANFMKCEWYNRCIMTWENIKPLYGERDFSQANLIDKMRKLLVEERNAAQWAESLYHREKTDGKPFDYTKLAGRVSE